MGGRRDEVVLEESDCVVAVGNTEAEIIRQTGARDVGMEDQKKTSNPNGLPSRYYQRCGRPFKETNVYI